MGNGTNINFFHRRCVDESNLLLKRHVVFLYALTVKKILIYISDEL